jgi:hypothetical protein
MPPALDWRKPASGGEEAALNARRDLCATPRYSSRLGRRFDALYAGESNANSYAPTRFSGWERCLGMERGAPAVGVNPGWMPF